MWRDHAFKRLSGSASYSRKELMQIFRKEKADLDDTAFRWALYGMLYSHKLFRIGYDSYATDKPPVLAEYIPSYSDKAKRLENVLKKRYPELEFVIFESVLLNEFLNHQIAQNTIYVQVEKDMSAYIFSQLQEELDERILLRPGKSEYGKYWTKDCIVVLDLISQSPLSTQFPHAITVEKMLVDIIAERSIAATFSPSEFPSLYANVLSAYSIDRRKLNRYAGRRGKAEEVREYLEEQSECFQGRCTQLNT